MRAEDGRPIDARAAEDKLGLMPLAQPDDCARIALRSEDLRRRRTVRLRDGDCLHEGEAIGEAMRACTQMSPRRDELAAEIVAHKTHLEHALSGSGDPHRQRSLQI